MFKSQKTRPTPHVSQNNLYTGQTRAKIPRTAPVIMNLSTILNKRNWKTEHLGTFLMVLSGRDDAVNLMKNPVKGIKDACRVVNIHRWTIKNDMDLGLKEITEKSIELIALDITKYLLNIKRFHSLIMCKQAGTGLEKFILQVVRHYPRLQQLTLNLLSCQQITDMRLKFIAKHITTHLTQLRSLTLDFFSCEQITGQGIKTLTSNIGRRLTQLQSLDINFTDGKKMTDDVLRGFIPNITRRITKLRHLTLQFSLCPDITDYGVKALGTDLGKYITHLLSLSLDFKCSRITDEGVQSIIKDIANYLKQLQGLEITFEGSNGITNSSVNVFASEIPKNLAKLRTLRVSFGGKNISNESLEFLTSEIKEWLPSLESLTCWFLGTSITKECKDKCKEQLNFISDVKIY